jgi:Ger(x)C family germination protein
MRMRRRSLALLFVLILFLLTGCWDSQDVEKLFITRVLGVDLDSDGQIAVYSRSPNFSKDAAKKSSMQVFRAKNLRDARLKFDTSSSKTIVGGKTEVILFSKAYVRKHDPIMELLDVMLRDAKNPVLIKLAVVDTPMKELMGHEPDETPYIGQYIKNLIDTTSKSNLTVNSFLQDSEYEHSEPGITPAFAEISIKRNRITVTGTSLFNHHGTYVFTIPPVRNSALLMLKDQVQTPLLKMIPLPAKEFGETGTLNYNIDQFENKIKPSYVNGKFRFDVQIKAGIIITQKSLPFKLRDKRNTLERLVESQIQHECENLIKEVQQKRLDPFGFGTYARAHQYPNWYKVKEDWGAAFSKADVHVSAKVKIKSYGLMQ